MAGRPRLTIRIPKETSVFSLRIPTKLLQDYDNLSEKSGRSRNELIKIAMEKYIQSVVVVEKKKS